MTLLTSFFLLEVSWFFGERVQAIFFSRESFSWGVFFFEVKNFFFSYIFLGGSISSRAFFCRSFPLFFNGKMIIFGSGVGCAFRGDCYV